MRYSTTDRGTQEKLADTLSRLQESPANIAQGSSLAALGQLHALPADALPR